MTPPQPRAAALPRRFDLDARTEKMVRRELNRPGPRLSDRELDAVGLRSFSLEALRGLDLRGFVALRKLVLDREKFEYDAAELSLAKLPELRAISKDPRLTTRQKIDQIRLKLFGEIVGRAEPDDAEPPDADLEDPGFSAPD